MPGDLIRVLMIGHPDPGFHESVRLENIPATWADGFSIIRTENDHGLLPLLAQARPQVIVSFGSLSVLKELQAASLDIRQRWIHFEDPAVEPPVLASRIMNCYVNFATRNRFPNEPLV